MKPRYCGNCKYGQWQFYSDNVEETVNSCNSCANWSSWQPINVVPFDYTLCVSNKFVRYKLIADPTTITNTYNLSVAIINNIVDNTIFVRFRQMGNTINIPCRTFKDAYQIFDSIRISNAT